MLHVKSVVYNNTTIYNSNNDHVYGDGVVYMLSNNIIITKIIYILIHKGVVLCTCSKGGGEATLEQQRGRQNPSLLLCVFTADFPHQSEFRRIDSPTSALVALVYNRASTGRA